MASAIGLVLRKPHLLFRKADPKDNTNPEDRKNLRPHLCTFDELPKWYQDNPHIRTGYRPVSNSYHSCIHSLTYLHNETMNVYTHLIPAITLAFALPTLQIKISSTYPDAPWTDRFILTLTPLTALLTLSLSTTYHTLMNHSAFISESCLLLDYVGILSLILSSFISGIYVGFYDSPFHQRLYWGMICSLIGISCLLVLHPRLQGPRFRPHRTTAFVLTALSGLAPIIHGMWLYGWSDTVRRRGANWWFAEGLWYGLGAVFFSSRIPERRGVVGKWDLLGSSHQIFHICVVLGASAHCWGVWCAWRAQVGGWDKA
ncbi:HlyIII-domain-containing protein [Zopfia rhizophila CBS 207.26]|uniref:HlyIII-domain-containing protein n=1 Tax=Zopfia rhizophila CBS 207.26 TaxID=1314779 RepID=A0A6A6E2T7_9PEZI|nr:HlyIII-domain-containing protein [Zopfia rhizophila CBS 207.26]